MFVTEQQLFADYIDCVWVSILRAALISFLIMFSSLFYLPSSRQIIPPWLLEDDCGLQEKEDRARPHSHQRGCSGAG
jgi:hypothetical protein